MRHLSQTAKCIRRIHAPVVFLCASGNGLFKSCSMTHYKRPVGHVAHSMQCTSHLFFSGSGLATYQHCSKVWADPPHLQPQSVNLSAAAHDLEIVSLGPGLFDKSARRFMEGRRI